MKNEYFAYGSGLGDYNYDPVGDFDNNEIIMTVLTYFTLSFLPLPMELGSVTKAGDSHSVGATITITMTPVSLSDE